MALQEIVSLYRESNRPTIRSSRFEATGDFSSLYPYILAVKELKDSELLRLDIDGEATSDLSGWSVSLSSDGSRVAIGAYNNDGVSGSASGHV